MIYQFASLQLFPFALLNVFNRELAVLRIKLFFSVTISDTSPPNISSWLEYNYTMANDS